jgi:L-ascorbate metabolism protein UlaG (beta-lactamase superfamily)
VAEWRQGIVVFRQCRGIIGMHWWNDAMRGFEHPEDFLDANANIWLALRTTPSFDLE